MCWVCIRINDGSINFYDAELVIADIPDRDHAEALKKRIRELQEAPPPRPAEDDEQPDEERSGSAGTVQQATLGSPDWTVRQIDLRGQSIDHEMLVNSDDVVDTADATRIARAADWLLTFRATFQALPPPPGR